MAGTKKVATQNGSHEVADFLAHLEHPFKKEIEVVRALILEAQDGLTEHIKWNAPSFCYGGDDRLTFNLQGKGFFRLIFHCGAKVKDGKGRGRLIEDPAGLLEWAADDRAILKLGDMKDVEDKRQVLTALVRAWMEQSVG